ncbi:MAG: PAS domain-containing sensor histidine kinase [Vicinamibacteria bacterium]
MPRLPGKPLFTGMTAGLAVGITAAVASASAAGAYLYSLHHFDSLLETARATALAEGDLIRTALEHQMIENDRSLIDRMIQSFGRQPRIERVLLLDRLGVVRYSSVPLARVPEAELKLESATCQACHRLPPEQRGSSRVIEERGGTLLRTVVPFRNRTECHGCHDPGVRINGILILDTDVGELRAGMNQDLKWLVLGSASLTLGLVAVIALVVRVLVLRRLQRFETTARLIAEGDLARRVPAEGSDTIAWLAREFNTMADSVTGLLGEVKSQRERLETVINSIDDGIVVLDPERKVLAANAAFIERTGRAREDVLNCCCRDSTAAMCSVSDCPTVASFGSGSRQVRICERRAADGASAWEEVHASPVRDGAGRIVGVVEVWRDISERRVAEARLAESHRLASLGLLASGFSHELNTPLATVLTAVEGIVRDTQAGSNGPAELARIGENAALAREQVLRCRGITQHFLRMSRGQSTPGDIVDLSDSLRAAQRLIEPTARAHGVAIELADLPAGLRVRADEAEIQHALINLMLNGIQACRPGGRVRLSAEAGERLRIRVVDDGCGIAPEHQQRIFEPFFSLRQGGTGLGLFLSLNFVRRWGGDITVSSAPGKGSSFELTLPSLESSLTQAGAS